MGGIAFVQLADTSIHLQVAVFVDASWPGVSGKCFKGPATHFYFRKRDWMERSAVTGQGGHLEIRSCPRACHFLVFL